MKIVYLIAATASSGGMERVLSGKVNYLVAHDYEVCVVTTDQRGRQPFFELDDRVQCHDLRINYESNNGRSLWNKLLHYPLKQWRHYWRLARLLGTIQADVVVSMFCNDVWMLPFIYDGSSKVLEAHFSKFKKLQYGRRGLWRLADEWRTRREDRVICRYDRFVVLTGEDLGYWGSLPNMEVIPNARPFETVTTASLTAREVIAVGRYCHQKNFEELIEIWHTLRHVSDGWHLTIVGDGELRPALQRQINDLKMNDEVTLAYPVKDIKRCYMQSSILVLTSCYEGLPMALIEAQASGLPIVAYACKCGPRDIVTEGVDGFLINEGDKKTFAFRLLSLMRSPDLRRRMGAAARLHSEGYSIETVMQKWITLFELLKWKK